MAASQNTFSAQELQEHDAREKFVFEFFIEAIQEMVSGFRTLPNGLYILPERANLILCFSMVDVMRKYWDVYRGLKGNGGNKVSFVSWLKEFCFVDNNPVFKKNRLLKKVSAEQLYSLRCSIVHFYGFPSEPNIFFSIAPYDASDKWVNETSDKLSHNGISCIILRPTDIHDLIGEGAHLMIGEMKKNNGGNPRFHFEGIKRVFEKVQKEGAKGIPLDPANIK